MSLAITIIAIITLVAGVFFNETEDKQNQNVLAESTNSPEPSISPIPSLSPTTLPTPISTPKNEQNNNLDSFIYPNSTIVSKSSSEISLKTNDDPNNVTPWYKSKLNELSFNATSFATTNTNGNISSELAGAKSNLNIEVEIKKSASENTVSILIKLK